MSYYLGISAGFHDAAISLIDSSGQILFAGHSERYSKIKNDPHLCPALVNEVAAYDVGNVAYYENPILKQLRQWYSGQGLDCSSLTVKNILTRELKDTGLLEKTPRLHSYTHHLSHAAAGFQTSRFDKATVVVIDAIGEFDTISIWAAEYVSEMATYKKLWSQKYPHSLGLFYSAATKDAGLKPLDEEYILMGMSAYGTCIYENKLKHSLLADNWDIKFKENLHLGLPESFENKFDLATSAQVVLEDLLSSILIRARNFNYSKNLVYMGGVALNCLANRLLGNYFDNIWIMPNPGDAGSSLGCAALAYGKRLNWKTAFLGHNITGPYPVNSLLETLFHDKIVGVASGQAEFGPRALGNRSLLADPRGNEIKDKVNEIKRRQKFRPFAPIILEELVDQYFDMPNNWDNSRYMQVIANCRHPDLFPAIVHHDGTSRVQTVPKDGSGIRHLLEEWYKLTGCPMLLNTSLNIRGRPMVNDLADAKEFQSTYGIKVFS